MPGMPVIGHLSAGPSQSAIQAYAEGLLSILGSPFSRVLATLCKDFIATTSCQELIARPPPTCHTCHGVCIHGVLVSGSGTWTTCHEVICSITRTSLMESWESLPAGGANWHFGLNRWTGVTWRLAPPADVLHGMERQNLLVPAVVAGPPLPEKSSISLVLRCHFPRCHSCPQKSLFRA